MNIEPDIYATLSVYDGRDKSHPLIATYPIINGTLPQGIVSTYQYMYVEFTFPEGVVEENECPTLRDCIKFTILVDTAKGWCEKICCM